MLINYLFVIITILMTYVIPTDTLTRWNTDLASLPGVELADVLVYLSDTCGWARERLKGFRQQDGYLLSQDKHISGEHHIIHQGAIN